MGTKTVRAWRPTKEEVDRIVAEMRPIIAELARHQVLLPGTAKKTA